VNEARDGACGRAGFGGAPPRVATGNTSRPIGPRFVLAGHSAGSVYTRQVRAREAEARDGVARRRRETASRGGGERRRADSERQRPHACRQRPHAPGAGGGETPARRRRRRSCGVGARGGGAYSVRGGGAPLDQVPRRSASPGVRRRLFEWGRVGCGAGAGRAAARERDSRGRERAARPAGQAASWRPRAGRAPSTLSVPAGVLQWRTRRERRRRRAVRCRVSRAAPRSCGAGRHRTAGRRGARIAAARRRVAARSAAVGPAADSPRRVGERRCGDERTDIGRRVDKRRTRTCGCRAAWRRGGAATGVCDCGGDGVRVCGWCSSRWTGRTWWWPWSTLTASLSLNSPRWSFPPPPSAAASDTPPLFPLSCTAHRGLKRLERVPRPARERGAVACAGRLMRPLPAPVS
jgi:hypothetical protein